jgi:RHS repeat-associated protein
MQQEQQRGRLSRPAADEINTSMLISNTNRELTVKTNTILIRAFLVCSILCCATAAHAIGGIVSDNAAPHFATNQNREDLEDMRVKVLGGDLRITRRWDGKNWQWNERWSDLGVEPDKSILDAKLDAAAQPTGPGTIDAGSSGGGTGGSLGGNQSHPYFLFRNGQGYIQSGDRLSSNVYENQLRLTITRLDNGYRWQDQDGNQIGYDSDGRMTHYQDRNAVRVSLERDANGFITAIKDHHGTEVVTWQWEDIPGATPLNNLTGDTYAPRRLVSITDYTGRQVGYQWNEENRLTQVTDVRGQAWLYAYETNGNLATQTDPDGREVNYVISQKGIVTSRIDEDGAGMTYTYRYDNDKKEYYLSSRDQAGTVIERWYDNHGIEVRQLINGDLQFTATVVLSDNSQGTENLVKRYSLGSTASGAGGGSYLGRDNNSQPVYVKSKTVTDARGNKTLYEYDQWKNVLKVTYPDASFISNTWFTNYANLHTHTDENGVVTGYQYDSKGNLLTLTEAKNTSDERITRYTYDDYGQLKTITTGESAANNTALATTHYDYDAYGNVTNITDPLDQVVSFSDYDALGNARTITDARANALPANEHYSWRRTFDAAGNLLTERDPDNRGTTYTYTLGGDIASVTEANNSTVTLTTNTRGLPLTLTDTNEHVTKLEYDKANRLTAVIDANNNTFRMTYDARGRLSSTVDGESHTTRFDYADNLLQKVQYPTFHETLDYDNRNRVKDSRQQANGQTYLRKNGYDLTSNLENTTDAESNSESYTYDKLNRTVTVTDAEGGVTTYTFDARDNLLKVKDPEERLTVYRYDLNDQLISETKHDAFTSGGATTTQQRRYAYDANGNLESTINPAQEKTVYTYDRANQLITTSVYATATSTQALKVITYNINALKQFTGYTQTLGTNGEGNPASGLTPDIIPLSETYTYTTLNQIESVTVNVGSFSKTYSYTYYPNGLKQTYTNPENITYTYYYNKNNQLTAVHIPGSGQLTYGDFNWLMPQTLLLPGGTKITLSYNDFLQVEERILKDPANNNIASAVYEYDRESNIKKITSEAGTYNFNYDNLYRLTEADYPLDVAFNDEAFDYDGVGNRISHIRTDNVESVDPETSPANATETTLAYNNQNQLDTTSDNTTYTYNANGHTATKVENGTTTEYIYNHEERLIAVKINNVTVGEYAYNPYGMRIKKTVNGQTTFYLYNDKGLAAEYDSSGSLIKEYHFHPQKTWMTDPLFQRTADNQLYYYQNDHLGTPQKLIKSNGAVVWSATYTAFGEATIAATSAIENNLRFPGQYFDAETGLHHNYFRDYDPATGRYIQEDPIGLVGGMNVYGYAYQNPNKFSDSLGLKPGDEFDSMDAAAKDALCIWNPRSVENGMEYAGQIYQDWRTGKYSYTEGRSIGGKEAKDSSNPYAVPKPWFTTSVAVYHTHGAEDPEYGYGVPGSTEHRYGNNNFSANDIDNANRRMQPSYLGTPSEGFWVYEPNTARNEKLDSNCECKK